MPAVKDGVARVFEQLRTGEMPQIRARPESGWEISLPSGGIVVRSTLQMQARLLIALGAEAVPELLPWVMSAHPALRYVAIFALEQITGISANFPYFSDTDEEGCRAKAIAQWRSWYATRTKAKSV